MNRNLHFASLNLAFKVPARALLQRVARPLICGLLLICAIGIWTRGHAQFVFWQDDFENATTPDLPASSTRNPSGNAGTTTSYFKRANNTVADFSLQAAFGTVYNGLTGSFLWVGEDHDTPFPGIPQQQIEWLNIDITGRTNIQFKGNFAANNVSGPWDNVNTGGTAPFGAIGNDFIKVEYAIDAGAYTQLIAFWGDDATPAPPGKSMKEDTNGDFIGDGAQLNINLTEYVKSVIGTGTTMKLRVTVWDNGSSEEWAIDNFRLTASPTCTAPTITCPGTQTLALNASCQATLPNYTSLATVTGPCSPTVTQSPAIGSTQSGAGALIVSLFATNTSLQSNTCTFTVNKVDNTAPTIACPANISVNNDPGQCGAVVTYSAPTTGDNCGPTTTAQTFGLASGSSFTIGQTTNTFQVTDASGNSATCSFTVDVADTENPTIICPPNMVVSTSANSCDAVVNFQMPTGSDNCGISQVVLGNGNPSGATFLLGLINQTLVASDFSSNVGTCAFTVTVVDSVAPIAICQNLTAYLDANGAATILASQVDNGSSDNCSLGPLSLDLSSFTCADTGSNVVTLTVSDTTGNMSSCTSTVTVLDTISPTVICLNDTVYLDQQGQASITPQDIDGGTTDNCGISFIAVSPFAFTVNDLGANTVLFTAADLNGNESYCNATVLVLDSITAVEEGMTGQIIFIASPNPAHDRLQVQVECKVCAPGDEIQLQLWSMGGQLLRVLPVTTEIQNQVIEIDLSGMASGNYLLSLHHNGRVLMKNIVKF